MTDKVEFNQVADFELKRLIKSKSWNEINKHFEEHSIHSNDPRMKHWIRSKYMIKDYHGCLDLCKIDKSDIDNSMIQIKCIFSLRSSLKINDDKLIENAILNYSTRFPSELEHKIANMRFAYNKKDYDDSFLISKEIMQHDKSNMNALLFHARSIKKLNKSQNIEKSSWEEIIKYDSENLEALNNLSRLYYTEGDEKYARDLLEIIFSIDPNYGPAFSTSIKINFDAPTTSKDFYIAQMYEQNKYEELINLIGGPSNANLWSLREYKFALRSLNNLKRYSEVIKLYELKNIDFNSDDVLLEQLLMAYYHLQDTTNYSKILKIFSEKSLTNISSMRLYLRHLIYFSDDEEYTFSELNNLLTIHNNDYLSDLLKFILKSHKYNLIVLLFPEYSLSEIFDPINGFLKSIINIDDLNDIWKNFDKKIVKSFESDKRNYSKKEFIIPFLGISSIDEKEELIQKIKSDLDNKQSKEKLLKIKDELSKRENIDYSYYENMNFTNSTLSISLSNYEKINQKKGDYFSAYLNYEKFNINGVLIKNNEQISSTDILQSDPRNSLGRYMQFIKILDNTDIIIISWLCSLIYEISPKEIISNDGLEHGKIAKLIMGYPK